MGDDCGPACEEFVRQRDDAMLCHMPAWTRMVEATFGQRGYYLVARKNGTVCGVLPLVHIRSKLFGNRMISQAFSDYGGPLTNGAAAMQTLHHQAVELTTRLACRHLELRNIAPMPYALHLRTDKVCMRLRLTPDPQDVWKALRPQIRNRIRKAEKGGITVTRGHCDLLDDFYRLWTVRMRELGTPCYPRRLFENILTTFPEQSRIFVAHCGGQVVAALLAYAFNGCASTRWGVALREYDAKSPNYLLNWSAMEYYCRGGASWLDLGRSTAGSSQHIFKKRWGAETVPLNWQYWTPPGQEFHPVRPDAPAYKRKIEIWKRLPLAVTRRVGPWMSRGLA